MTRRLAILWLLLGAAAQLASAQDLVFHHLSVEEGLSRTWVHSLLKDSRGFLWVGTEGGLDRFDGQRIVEYKPKRGDPTSLAAGRVNVLLEDRAGQLWVGTQAGLQRYDRERDRFELVPMPPGGRPLENIQGLAADARGRVLVASTDGLSIL